MVGLEVIEGGLANRIDLSKSSEWDNLEWKRFEEKFNGDPSIQELHHALRIMADYDEVKLYSVLFHKACLEMETKGINPSRNLSELLKSMRDNFFEVGKKVFKIYDQRKEDIRVKINGEGEGREDYVAEPDSFEYRDIPEPNYRKAKKEFVPRFAQAQTYLEVPFVKKREFVPKLYSR